MSKKVHFGKDGWVKCSDHQVTWRMTKKRKEVTCSMCLGVLDLIDHLDPVGFDPSFDWDDHPCSSEALGQA